MLVRGCRLILVRLVLCVCVLHSKTNQTLGSLMGPRVSLPTQGLAHRVEHLQRCGATEGRDELRCAHEHLLAPRSAYVHHREACAAAPGERAFGGIDCSEHECILTGELCSRTCLSLAEILVLVGGAILPAPAVPASTLITAGLKRVQEHSAPVNMTLCDLFYVPAHRTQELS